MTDNGPKSTVWLQSTEYETQCNLPKIYMCSIPIVQSLSFEFKGNAVIGF